MDELESYGLVMPFVVCESEGGLLNDHAFVAGCRFGQDSAEVRRDKPEQWQQYVYPEMVPQYDLLAMDQGYAMTAKPWDEHPDEWVLVTFRQRGTSYMPDKLDKSTKET